VGHKQGVLLQKPRPVGAENPPPEAARKTTQKRKAKGRLSGKRCVKKGLSCVCIYGAGGERRENLLAKTLTFKETVKGPKKAEVTMRGSNTERGDVAPT